MNRRGLVALALLGGPLAACKDTQIVVGGLHEVTSLRALPNRALDILFVVDDSPSMQDEQAALATNFPHMMDVLGELDGGLPDVHIGVITSDLGTSGGPAIGSGPGSCAGFGDAGALQGAFLSDVVVDGVRVRSYPGELRDAFTQLALVGETGCGFEQHLGALRAALTNPANAGFLRPEANLAVVILADEDDCTANPDLFAPASPELGPIDSFRCFARGVVCDGDDPTTPGAKTGCVPRSSRYMDDVQPFVTALLATKADARMIMTAAIVGPPAPVEVTLASVGGGAPTPTVAASCTHDGTQTAFPAVRIGAFLDAFLPRSTLATLCSNDFSAPLATIGATAKRLVGDPCIDTAGLADAEADLPGIQPACEVLDIRDTSPTAPSELAACTPGETDCYELVADAVACPRSVDHLRLHVRRAQAAPADTWTHVRCQVASDGT